MSVHRLRTSVYLALGSNLKDRWQLIRNALLLLEKGGCTITSVAPFIETKPWGFLSENLFLNTVVEVQTDLCPEDLLSLLLSIEISLGRTQKSSKEEGYADRTIDIDILLYGDCVLRSEQLTIPHMYMHRRLFVLEPLSLIAPDFRHPVTEQSVIELTELLQKEEEKCFNQ